jgi:hypothetical protein
MFFYERIINAIRYKRIFFIFLLDLPIQFFLFHITRKIDIKSMGYTKSLIRPPRTISLFAQSSLAHEAHPRRYIS